MKLAHYTIGSTIGLLFAVFIANNDVVKLKQRVDILEKRPYSYTIVGDSFNLVMTNRESLFVTNSFTNNYPPH